MAGLHMKQAPEQARLVLINLTFKLHSPHTSKKKKKSAHENTSSYSHTPLSSFCDGGDGRKKRQRLAENIEV